ncbi:MAG: Elongation factor P [Candidatus Woesebacteria bacterium GW2011_GWB1_38_5b]|uniref:Elongation factor P n=1 Tax=Candidatus Woesebacteria bacterium GW2011_GWB1_38_5b TaxID=1618569 RepID=A0A0G0KK22_9BACT|nr:MAG: Elongation factor P [Candidatus Woesebacteria bacterium GW2011_GWB1_38_5b]
MIASTQLRNGTTFLRNNEPHQVIEYALIKMGRGGATVKITARNLITGAVINDSYSSNIKVDEVTTHKRKLQYLFRDGNTATFMDPTTFEQIELPIKVIEHEIKFIKEGDSADILFWSFDSAQDKVLSVELPPKVTLEVVETDPGVKGNSASNIYKSAKLENAITIKVPLFINTGDKIRVDTRTSAYVERAK